MNDQVTIGESFSGPWHARQLEQLKHIWTALETEDLVGVPTHPGQLHDDLSGGTCPRFNLCFEHIIGLEEYFAAWESFEHFRTLRFEQTF